MVLLNRKKVQKLTERKKNVLRAEALRLLAQGQDASGGDAVSLPRNERARLRDLVRCGMLPSDPAPAPPITKKRDAQLRDMAQARLSTSKEGFTMLRLNDSIEAERVRTHEAELSLGPDAKAKRDHVAKARQNAPKGGKASPAHYKDADIEAVFNTYVTANREKGKTLWEACNALIRPGRALCKYKRITGLWDRVERIAQSKYGITREQWFAELK